MLDRNKDFAFWHFVFRLVVLAFLTICLGDGDSDIGDFGSFYDSILLLLVLNLELDRRVASERDVK